MNGVRSISMRKGYWLTALAAAVLLAASSGTAWAQSVGFSKSSVTVMEGADGEDKGPAQIVDIRISGLTAPSDGPPADLGNLASGLGMLTITHEDLDEGIVDVDARSGTQRLWLILEGSTALADSHMDTADDMNNGKVALSGMSNQFAYDNNGIIRLAIIDPVGDNNWKDDEFDIILNVSMAGVSNTQAKVTVTFSDVTVAPVVKFDPASIKLTERSQTTTTVTVAPGDDKALSDALETQVEAISTFVHLMVSDPDMVSVGEMGSSNVSKTGCYAEEPPVVYISGPVGTLGEMGDDDAGSFNLTTDIGDMYQTGVTLTIEACDETMDFRNAMLTLMPTASSLMGAADGPGDIGAGAGVSIDIESDEDVPVVTFSAPGLLVDEGEDTSVYIVTTTMQGDEVGEVDLSVSGEALITLSQKGTALTANADGTYTADFGESANTRLTISADDDESLYDDQQKTAAVTIVDANGATIGDEDAVTVTVNGKGVAPEPEPEPEPEPDAIPTVSFTSTAVPIDEGGNGVVSIGVVDEDEVGVDTVMVSMSGSAMIALYQDGSALEAGADGNYAADPSADITVGSEPDEELMDGELKRAMLTIVDAEAYDLGDNGSVTITVNGDSNVPGPLPSISFLSTSLTLKEGASSTVRLQRTGDFRGDPGTVMVSMEGDAVLSLSKSGNALADDGMGNYTVSLDSETFTELTVTSDSDPDLVDGAEKSATLTISDGYGAVAGDSAMLTIAVIGSTAVPALPLVGQLLLALFLMVGGARLYRRRNG